MSFFVFNIYCDRSEFFTCLNITNIIFGEYGDWETLYVSTDFFLLGSDVYISAFDF